MKIQLLLFVPFVCAGVAVGILDASGQQPTSPDPHADINPVPQLATPPVPAGRPKSSQPPSPSRKGGKHFDTLQAMQDEYFNIFRTRPGFGASRTMAFPSQDELTLDGFTYRFAAPELIGLEDQPLAYERRWEMVTMAALTNRTIRASLKTRPLMAEEVLAVAELRRGKSIAVLPIQTPVVTLHGTGEVAGLLAVGALRARTECAQCHQCKEGTLLGAFSYRLVPTNAVPLITLARASVRR